MASPPPSRVSAARTKPRDSPRTGTTAAALRAALREHADPADAAQAARYFLAGPGGYGEGDRFHGVRVPAIRALVKAHRGTSLAVCRTLLRSPWHEERMLALLLMVDAYQRRDQVQRQAVFDTYLANLEQVNNWDLVDSSAPHIVGAHLAPTDTATLEAMAASGHVWTRRIAMLATQFHIRRGEFGPAMRIATLLRHDPHPLLHKAVGWMLREIGDRDRTTSLAFLGQHWREMPRTAVRYAIEHLSPSERRRFMR